MTTPAAIARSNSRLSAAISRTRDRARFSLTDVASSAVLERAAADTGLAILP
jgi:hypothetical protein